jgi:hypothetical protein
MATQVEGVLFHEEQSFRQPWLWVMMPGSLLVMIAVVAVAFIHDPAKAQSLIVPAVVAVPIIIGTIALLLFMKLTVQVEDGQLRVRFFPLVKREIPVAEIARWEARAYRPILEYGGWGIRYGWKGMAYNVSGKRGVQLEFTNGKRLLIGSQRPDELAAAITHAKRP